MAKRAWGDEDAMEHRMLTFGLVLLVLFIGLSLPADFRAWEIVRLYTAAVR